MADRTLDLILNLLRQRRPGYGGMEEAPPPPIGYGGMPGSEVGYGRRGVSSPPRDPLAALGILDPTQAPPFEPMGPQLPEPGELEGRRRGFEEAADRRDLQRAFDEFGRSTDVAMEDQIRDRLNPNPFQPRATDLLPSIGEPPTLRPEGTLPSRLIEALRAHARTSTPQAIPSGSGGMPDAGFKPTVGPMVGPMDTRPPAAGRPPPDEEGGFSGGRLRFPVPGDFGITEGPFDQPPARQPTVQAPQGEMDPERRLALMKGARMFREAASEFANIPNAADYMLARHGVPMRDRRVVAEDLRADEERLRRGDFENPRSPASQMARQMLSDATGQPVPEEMSAAAIAAISPVFDRLIRGQLAGKIAGFNQAMQLAREGRAQRGEKRHVTEREDTIRRGREKELRAAITAERKDQLSKTSRIGELTENIEQADNAIMLIDQGTPQAFGTAISVVMKGIGKEAGNIAQREREQLLGEIGIPGYTAKASKFIWGDYTKEQRANLRRIATEAKTMLETRRREEQQKRIDTFMKTHRELLEEGGIGLEDIQERLGVKSAGAGMEAPATGGTANAGKVRVRFLDENGAVWMSPEDAAQGEQGGVLERL